MDTFVIITIIATIVAVIFGIIAVLVYYVMTSVPFMLETDNDLCISHADGTARLAKCDTADNAQMFMDINKLRVDNDGNCLIGSGNAVSVAPCSDDFAWDYDKNAFSKGDKFMYVSNATDGTSVSFADVNPNQDLLANWGRHNVYGMTLKN